MVIFLTNTEKYARDPPFQWGKKVHNEYNHLSFPSPYHAMESAIGLLPRQHTLIFCAKILFFKKEIN